jgi:replicative DNA helicase
MNDLQMSPHSIESEQSVLGGLLRDNAAWPRIRGAVDAGDFYREDHRLIFKTIVHLIEAGKAADILTVNEELYNEGVAESCGGLEYLNGLAQAMPSASKLCRYAEIVRNRGLARRLIAAGHDISAEAFRLRDKDVAAALIAAEACLGYMR